MNEKMELLSRALAKGMVMIHLDARRPGVSVPENLRNETYLRLNLSYRFVPSDLEVTEWGIRSTLSFFGVFFKAAVPWSAVFAVSSHVDKELFGMFPNDMPPEVLRPAPGTAAPRGPAGAPESDTKADAPEQPGQPKRHLRLVN